MKHKTLIGLSMLLLIILAPVAFSLTYNEKITKPSMTDNSYSIAVSNFIKEKCGNCKDVMIIGDDFVVPYTRISPTLEKDYFDFWGIISWGTYNKGIYSDSYYIQRAFDRTFADLDEIFARKVNGKLEQEKRVKIILPSSLTAEQRIAVDTLKQTLTTKFNPRIEEISSTGVACNQVQWFDDLKGAALIIIGTTKSNPPALNCYPFLVNDETNSSVFVDINQWDNKENAVIIGSDHPNAIYAFNEVLEKGIYKDIHTKSWSLLDIGVGIGAGLVIVGGAAATIAGAPLVAGAIVIGGGAIVIGTSFTNECIVKNYGSDNWGWCVFDVGATLAGGTIIKFVGHVAGKILSPVFKPLIKSGGFKKVVAFFVKIKPKISIQILKDLEESFTSGQLESLGKMISKLSGTEFSNTIKYANLWGGNPFSNSIGESKLIRIFDSRYSDVLVDITNPTKRIKNSAVLLEGKETGNELVDRGFIHFKMNHLDLDYQPTKSKFIRTINGEIKLFSEDEVFDLIKKTLTKGFPVESNSLGNSVYELAIDASDKVKGVRVVIDSSGEVITAIPLKTPPTR